jgi:hypothetical protein
VFNERSSRRSVSDFGELGVRAPRRDEVAFALEALDRVLKRRGCLVGPQHDTESNPGTVDATTLDT